MSQENMTNNDGVDPNLDAKRREELGTPGAPTGSSQLGGPQPSASRSNGGFSMTEHLMKKFSGVLGGLKKGTSKAGTLFRVTPTPQPQAYRFNYKVNARGGYYKKKQE